MGTTFYFHPNHLHGPHPQTIPACFLKIFPIPNHPHDLLSPCPHIAITGTMHLHTIILKIILEITFFCWCTIQSGWAVYVVKHVLYCFTCAGSVACRSPSQHIFTFLVGCRLFMDIESPFYCWPSCFMCWNASACLYLPTELNSGSLLY